MKKIESMSVWVIGYSIGYMMMTLLYCLPRILAEYSTLDVSHISENFTFPLEIFAYGLLAITSAYAGLDRAAFMAKSNQMELGQYDVGNVLRLKVVILLLGFICIESYALNFYLGHSVSIGFGSSIQTFKGVDLPLDGITTALVSAIVIYVAGNKAIKNCEYNHKEAK